MTSFPSTGAAPVANRPTIKDGGPLAATPPPEIEIGLFTGGFDRPYAFGLAMALTASGVGLEMIGSDAVDSPELHTTPNLSFLNLQGSRREDVSFATKASRLLLFYARFLCYAATARPRIFHILWNSKLEFFDRTLLMLYYKLLGKKIVLTAHNVNAGKRDSKDTLLNRLTLKIQYRLVDHIFVHTEKMKSELREDFGVAERAITVIPFGINNSVPDTDLTSQQAKQQLGIGDGEKTILFFGKIVPYKGLDILVAAFQRIAARKTGYRLIIAGEPRGGCEKYLADIQQTIAREATSRDQVVQKIQFIPDEDTQVYFKAADVLALPYTMVFQSGVLFLAYSFGLPVLATDVGPFREDILEGRTGFLCKAADPVDLAKSIEAYFESDLFKGLAGRRQDIRDYANVLHSWDVVAAATRNVYRELLGNSLS